MAEQDDNQPMRASDADREAIAERLRTAQSEGRLSLTEYDERLRAAYAAVTQAELAPLTADLPQATPSHSNTKDVARRDRRAHLVKEWNDWGKIAVLLVGIWAVTSLAAGGLTFFWPIFPLGIWGAILLGNMLFSERGHGRSNRDSDGGEAKDQ